MSSVYTPRPYGPLAVDFLLSNKRCALFAGTGTGKTSLVLTALDALFVSGAETRPALALGPLRVARKTWREEAAKWDHLSDIVVSQITGTEKERRLAMKRDASLYTTNYENVPWLMNELAGSFPYGTVIADESTKLKGYRGSVQTSKAGNEFIRSAGSMRARELAKVAHKHVRRWINLTGTPSPNGLKDLWGSQWFVDAGMRLGRTYEAFERRWFRTGYDGYGLEPLPYADAEIHDRLRDCCLTIDAADYFDISKPDVRPVYVDLKPKARQLYNEMEKKMFAEIGGHEVEAFNAAAKTMKCLQLANGAAYVEDGDERKFIEVHNEKIDAVEGIIEEACGMPVIVAYEFQSDLTRLMKAFPKGRHLQTEQDEDDFKAGKTPILFAHPKSAGHGIDGFQYVTNIVILMGCNWDLEQRIQIIERVGPTRQAQAGFRRGTLVYPIIARDTIDELVLARHETKKTVQDLLLDACKRRTA